MTLITVAGNEADAGISCGRPPDAAIITGACQYFYNTLGRVPYLFIGDEVSFVEFADGWGGISFAAPFFAGKVALLAQQKSDITQDEVMTYFKNHAIKLTDKGTGYGYANLGEAIEQLS